MINSYAPGTTLNITSAGFENSNEWLAYISSHPDATIYHHPAWLKVLGDETGNEVVTLIAKDETNNIRGILPLQFTTGMFFGLGGLAGSPRLSSLPRTPIAGILADDKEIARMLLSAAVELVNKYKGTLLQIKTTDPDIYKNKLIRIIPWRENFSIELPQKKEDIKFGSPRNQRRIKWAVNKAANAGVKIRKADSLKELKDWYKLYLETSRWHAVPPRSYKFFKDLFDTMPPNLFSLLLAEKDNHILAGSVFLMYNKTVFYSFNGRDKDTLNLRPNELIQYTAIYQACNDGYNYYDMGEVSGGQEGLSEFKKKWGCISKQIYHVYYSPKEEVKDELMSDAPGNLRTNIWRKIPLGLTETLGKLINNRL